MKQPTIICVSCSRRFRSLKGVRKHVCRSGGTRTYSAMPLPLRIPTPPTNNMHKKEAAI